MNHTTPLAPTPPATDDALSLLVEQLMGLLHRRMAGETLSVMHEAGLTLPQMVALHSLKHAGAQSINSLAEQLNLSTSAVSHLVDRLVDRELVDRAEDPEDRRQKRVGLTPAGTALLERLVRSRNAEIAAVASRLDPQTHRTVVGLLEEVVQHLQKSL